MSTQQRGLGGRSTWWAEQMSAQFIPFGYGGNWALYAEREATLSEDLSKVEDRSLRYFRLIGHETDLKMSRQMAQWLYLALGTALERTKGDEDRA